MNFQSQAKKTKISSRRGSSAQIVITQSFKPSTKAEELSVRIATEVLEKVGLNIGGKADVLYDEGSNQWMIKADESGFTVTGKEGAPTGLIRYTLKSGHARLTDERAKLPVRLGSDDTALIFSGDNVIFRLEE